ncbi:MAG: hypothetical protein VCC20_07605 [Myxococcota bacterium]
MSEANGILLRRHLRFGWWSLAFFLLIGTTLEVMHGLKVGYYLDASNSTRRLLWTLAHAHGSLLGLVHIGFAATLGLGVVLSERSSRWASGCLAGASFLLPGGFAIGGWFAEAGDPGLGVLLVPVGAAALLVSVVLTARAVRERS